LSNFVNKIGEEEDEEIGNFGERDRFNNWLKIKHMKPRRKCRSELEASLEMSSELRRFVGNVYWWSCVRYLTMRLIFSLFSLNYIIGYL